MTDMERHEQELAVLLRRSKAETKRFILHPNVSLEINKINLLGIKQILKYFKTNVGYENIKTDRKKHECVTQLSETLLDYRQRYDDDNKNNNSKRPKLNHEQGGDNHQQQQLRQQQLLQQQQLHMQRAQQQLLQKQQSQTAAQIAAAHEWELLKPEINNPLKVAVYNELKAAGFTNIEAGLGIKEATEEEMKDIDMLMYKIAYKKNGVEIESQSATALHDQIQEQEDRDMDQAILNSEGEREVIQNRKKQRVSLIKEDCLCSLLEAQEFKHSILIGRNLKEKGTLLALMTEMGICQDIFKNEILVDLLKLLDIHTCKLDLLDNSGTLASNGNSPSSSSSSFSSSSASANSSDNNNHSNFNNDSKCSCPEIWRQVRAVLSRLLLLETDAMKFSKEHCHAYFLQLACRIDQAIESDTSMKKNRLTTDAEDQILIPEVETCLKLITVECEALESHMYSIPDDASTIPRAFREADPTSSKLLNGSTKYSLDDDGFELA